jgi:hypothetical protein
MLTCEIPAAILAACFTFIPIDRNSTADNTPLPPGQKNCDLYYSFVPDSPYLAVTASAGNGSPFYVGRCVQKGK